MSLALILIFIALAVTSRRVKWLSGLGFTFVVLATGAAAMTFPAAFISWGGFELKSAITPLVQVILLGMGLTWGAFSWIFLNNLFSPSFLDIRAIKIPNSAAFFVWMVYGVALTSVAYFDKAVRANE
jgi:hypothetical protein